MPRETFTQHPATLAPHPPLLAYREDLARRAGGEEFGTSDATWLSVASILSHAVDVPQGERPGLLATLRDVVASDPAVRDVLPVTDHEPPADLELDAVSPIVRALVERIEDAGALRLAYSMLWTLADADLRLSVLERGRLHAQLGRVAWKAGALDTSREQYRRAEVLGRTARIPELRIRAWVGYSIVARQRGNYPEVRKWAARAVDEADRAGLTALSSLAYHSLMLAAAVAGDLNMALAYGWRAFEGAAGDRLREASMLGNLAQYLLESGRPEVALRGFTAALERHPPARTAFPALGGLAVAGAALGERALVHSARARVERLAATTHEPYAHAYALVELSQALAAIGDAEDAAECRARALELAERHSYHEIVHRLETLRTAPPSVATEPFPLDRIGTEVVRAVTSLGFAGSAAGGA